jgi:phosphoribosylformylglycinamidine synthase
MVGMLPEGQKQMTLDFKNVGDLIYVIGHQANDINSSQYLVHYKKVQQSPIPYFNLDEEYNNQHALLKAISSGLIESAHDTSEGGLFAALVESAMPKQLGFEISKNNDLRNDAYLFGETQGRIVVSIKAENQLAFETLMKDRGVEISEIGKATTGSISIASNDFGNIASYTHIYENRLGELLA